MKKVLSRTKLGDMEAVYLISEDQHVGMTLIPDSFEQEADFTKGKVDPLVQISLEGDAAVGGFAAGNTSHNSRDTRSFRYVKQEIRKVSDDILIETVVSNDNGVSAVHTLSYYENVRAIRCCVQIKNDSSQELVIEKIASFSLSEITPYAADEAAGRLMLHRIRSRWSAEGRVDSRSIEELQLEPSWARFGLRVEKFGTVGSMPVRGFFPFAAIEDKKAGVTWGVQLACSSSWQMEAVRIDENLILSGGLADYDFGHWKKNLLPGESFDAPEAYLTVTKGSPDDACERMLDMQTHDLLPHQRVDHLPLFFNEYCTTWGVPEESMIEKMAELMKDKGAEYFVIDAGWYADEVCGWQDNMGDWIPSVKLFPGGLKKTTERIKAAGMKPGIWFELETVGKDAKVRADLPHLLKKNGKLLVTGTRAFWNMTDPWVEQYLTEKVIDFLNFYGFEYIKIDYNETIGIGCDGAESLGEGLRQNIEGTKAFFEKIRKEVPGITIEICSSGGHRLEPGFMKLADYLSFSDAHEEREIPVIGANLHRLVLPQKSQIWAVLQQKDDDCRVAYSIAAGMYGALCISGDILNLSEKQWDIVDRGTAFYKKVSPIIIDGKTVVYGGDQFAYRKLEEYQAGVRYSRHDGKVLAIVHSFALNGEQEIRIPLKGRYRILDRFEAGEHRIRVEKEELVLNFGNSFDAAAVLLELC